MALDGWRSNLSPDASNYISRLEGRLKSLEGTVNSVDSRVSYLITRSRKISKKQLVPQGQIPSSVTVGSGSASVADDGTVTFTGCSSVSLNGVFDGLGADLYAIYGTFVTSGGGTLITRLRRSGVDETTLYYRAGVFATLSSGPTRSSASSGNAFGLWVPTNGGSGSEAFGVMYLSKPGIAGRTNMTLNSTSNSFGSDFYHWSESGTNTVSGGLFDGFTLVPNGVNISGTLKVVKVG